MVTDSLIQLCNAVEYLHYHDIIHGAVHPYNMIMSSLHSPRVVLSDYSQARKAGVTDPIVSCFKEFCGTPPCFSHFIYMQGGHLWAPDHLIQQTS